ncbi:MAG TPA: ABC transporter ATP-binding protein [Solirubrobacteraceae bacterium]|nr:ABC transporter ATP-binding protein [Solirubrobacteraceae bacterium]
MSGHDDAAIAARDLRVRRGRREVLHGVTFALPAGRIAGLVGPSGGGKTTLMRALVGVQRGVSGELRVLGLAPGSAALRRRVGYGTQTQAAYDDLGVRENLEYFAALLGAPRGQVEEVLRRVDLTDAAGQLARSLSGGQRSRLSLAIALLGRPELLVLDEPTVGLDPLLRERLWALFRELAAGGVTLLISSHVMDEAARCEEVLLVRDGRILAQGAPGELQRRTGSDDLEGAFLALIAEGR